MRTAAGPLNIAISGKGGAGKSLLTAVMARILAHRGQRVLVVDLDVLPGVTLSLGRQQPLGVRVLPGATLASRSKMGAALVMAPGFAAASRWLAHSGPLRRWWVLGDLPAGPRPAAYRQYVAYADLLLVVAEPTEQSILAARRIVRLGQARSDLAVMVVANKVADEEDEQLLARRVGIPVTATIPFDDDVSVAERSGQALTDRSPASPVVAAVEGLLDVLRTGRAVTAVGSGPR